ncbi:NUDIX domain-containing protein [Candidatus Parcubacteria bacterium]|nr:NUDIX domain-containing protein [Candidatus Parcubacteria bacterium]
MPVERSAGAVIFRGQGGQRLYLLLQYGKRKGGGFHWDFTKGHLDKGETTEAAIRREVAEETGIVEIEFISGFRETLRLFFRNPDGKTVLKFVAFRVARTKTAAVKLSPEHIGFVWLPYAAALRRLTFKNGKTLLMGVENFLNAHPAGTSL